MLRFVAGAGLALAACQDPTVTVRVELPDTPRPYGDLVASLSVTVLAPADPALDCDALAFGRVDADAIALSEVTGVTLQGGDASAAIAGVPRLGAKLWLAEGRDADGNLVVAGCAAQGDVDADSEVTIAAEPSAQITVAPHAADAAVPATLAVTVDDGLAPPDPLASRALHWDVYGAGGQHLEGDAAVDAAGAATLALAAPDAAGPASIQVRARWARSQPVVVPAFESVAPVGLSVNRACTGNPLETLTVDTADWRAFHVGGHDAIVGLARDGTRDRLYVAAWDGHAAADGCSADLGVSTFTVLRATAADPVDRALVLTSNQWSELEVTGDASGLNVVARPPVAWVNLTGVAPVAVVTVPACGTDDGAGDVVLAQLIDGRVRAFDATGHAAQSAFADALTAALPGLATGAVLPRLTRAGCVGRGAGEPAVQAVLLTTPRQGDATVLPRYLALADGDGRILPVASFGAAGFGDGDDPLFLGGSLDPSGAKVVRYRLADGAGGLELREVGRDDSLGPPASVTAGYLDGDDQLDVAWGLVDAVQGGAQDARLQVSLGCGAGDLALDGVSPAVATGAAAVFLAPDPDHTADLMIGTSRAAAFLDTDLTPTP